METSIKKGKAKPSTIEQAVGDGPMMSFSDVRSEADVKFMSEWVEKRKVAISSSFESSASCK